MCLCLYHVTRYWWMFWWRHTDLKIIWSIISIKIRNRNYKKNNWRKSKLQFGFSGISLFSDWLRICWNDLFKPTISIQNCIYISFRITLTQLFINHETRPSENFMRRDQELKWLTNPNSYICATFDISNLDYLILNNLSQFEISQFYDLR